MEFTNNLTPLFDNDAFELNSNDVEKKVKLEKNAGVNETNRFDNDTNPQNAKIINFTLPSGKKVEMDLSRFKIRTIMNARACAQGGFKTTLYILADICKFDGQTVTVPEMDEWDGYDLLTLEDEWDKARNNIPKHQV